jgi:ornithine--oxo-acid transaminase
LYIFLIQSDLLSFQGADHYLCMGCRPVPPSEARNLIDMDDTQSPRRDNASPIQFDILNLFRQRLGENSKLHAKYINPAWAKSMKLIGYDRIYTRAEGCHLWDNNGRRYLDCISSFCVSNIGHNHPIVRRALSDVLSESLPNLIQLDIPLLSGLLAEALVKWIPWLDMVFFANSGSEAIEAALKFARCVTKRPRILYADHSYHGLTYGALSVTGHAMWREGFAPLLPETKAVPFNDADAIERELAGGNVAAVILEPIQVGAGIIIPSDDYLPRVQELCRKHKAILIFDEIHTGFGRTGTFLAAEHWKVEPDIVCLSKGLSAAMVPVSALVARKEIMQGVFSRLDRSEVHATTFGGNNLAMVSGLAALAVLDSENLIARCREMGEYFLQSLQPFAQKYELVKAVRGKGLLMGVEFGEPKSFMLRQAWTLMHKINPGLFAQAFTIPLLEKHAVLTQVAGSNQDVLKVAPAFVVTREDVDWFVRALDEVLFSTHKFPGPFWEVAVSLAKNALL